ncbi:MAG TPA: serine/threonine-protein kinase [Thermoanaerobaculia bacterium]|jgi:serine/threonine protein kinase|nr:serine/threonine-protein kinase [Thermoanaerobaculia bacterium]
MTEPLETTLAETPSAKRRTEHEPRRIDRYRLGELLGQGGMGSVYAAEQLEPVRRSVALKVIRAGGRASDRIVARFELERQVLALLEHPNIARLYDAGVTPEGDPYFVMERVEGLAITEHADRAKLPVRARIELFLDVCHAIEHAHQKGILHRDLKPSNVLVAEAGADGDLSRRPVPKVIDFGIAKAIEGDLATENAPTQLGFQVGTIAFASPEQLDPEAAKNVDTRTDVYGLGLLLYLLLAGESPFPGRGATALIERILNAEPEPLARRFSAAESSGEIASSRGTDEATLARELSGDLEWIVRRALEKRPEDRYPSVAELRADLERYLGDRPVLASPPSFAVKAKKFVRRNRLAVAASALIALSLVAGVVATSIALVRSRRAETRAASEAEKATAVNQFLTDMLASASPLESGREVKVADLLDRASADLAVRFRDRPEVEAALHLTLGTTYDGLGLAEPALAERRRALEIRRRVLGPGHPDTLEAQTFYAMGLLGAGRLQEAIALSEKTVAAQSRILPPDDPKLLDSRFAQVMILHELTRSEEALPIARDSAARLKRTRGADDKMTLSAEALLAQILDRTDHLAESEALHRDLLPRMARVKGADYPEVLSITNNLGNVLTNEEKFAEAEAVYRDLGARQVRILGPEHPETLTTRHNLVRALVGEGKLAEAETLCRATLEIRRRTLGPDHPHTIYSLGALGNILVKEGKLAEARKILPDALARAERVLGPDHNTTKRARDNLAKARVGTS